MALFGGRERRTRAAGGAKGSCPARLSRADVLRLVDRYPSSVGQSFRETLSHEDAATAVGLAVLLACAVQTDALSELVQVVRVGIGGRLLAALHSRRLPPVCLLREASFESLER